MLLQVSNFSQNHSHSHSQKTNSPAVRDFVFTTEKRRESEDILDKLDVPYQINLFADVDHGFSVRCDLSKPRQKFAKEQAFAQAVAWFNEYIKA